MTDFNLRPYAADDGIDMPGTLDTVSSDWAIVVDDKVVGRLQADEPGAAIAVRAEGALARAAAERFLAHHLLEAPAVTVRENGASRTFTRPAA